MNNSRLLIRKKPVKDIIIKYAVILSGAFLYGIGFQFFMYPNSIASGGVAGLSMIVNCFTGLPVGVTNIVLNIPLFLYARKHFGLGFLISSLVGMAASSVLVDIFATTGYSATGDPMLASIIGGVIKGIGLGLMYYTGATTGGLDIVVKAIRIKHPNIRFGTVMLAVDAMVIVAYAFILNKYESAMYSIIALFVVSKMVDLVLYGTNPANVCYIISENSEALTNEILSGSLKRGVTILEGEGAYSHHRKQIIMCVVRDNQIAELRRIVKRVDEHAFVIVTDAKDVFGKGFESITEVK